ncbi:MAG: FAD-dependent oxidoreductase [Verrucomicrobiota bacterium]
MPKTIQEPSREIPLIGDYDVVVCGGGMAGCGAAIAAARQGADVLLIERLEMLGGLGSAGCVGNFCAAEGGTAGSDIVTR